MNNVPDNQILTPEERKFMEFMNTGDDFIKIEIFRSAASFYGKALALKPGDKEAGRKLAETREKIKKENKAIYIIITVAAVAVLLAVVLV